MFLSPVSAVVSFDIPPAPTPRPVLLSIARSGIDLYKCANYLFVVCAVGYLLADLARVAFPTATINETHGSNASNGVFMFFALLYVFDCTLYFLVYNQWEREALEEERQKRMQEAIYQDQNNNHEEEEEEDQTVDKSSDTNEQRDDGEEDGEQEKAILAGDGVDGGVHRRKVHSDHAVDDFASRTLSQGRLGDKAKWCFFSHEGGLVNVMEVTAALIFATDATMTFFAGIANVDRIIQRRWDAATMTGDAVASAIFLSDSIFFHHIYVRTLHTKVQLGNTLLPVSCFNPKDSYFWSSITNVIGSIIYFIAALWGVIQQNDISTIDNMYPNTYNTNMVTMLQKLHALFVVADVF